MNQLLEDTATMFVILKLVKTGASRSKENDVSRLGGVRGEFDGAFESDGALNGDSALNLAFDFFGGGTDEQCEDGFSLERFAERRVVAAFVLATEDDENFSRESGESFESGIHVGGFGVVEIADAVKFGDEFETMLDSGKSADGGGDFCGLGSGKASGSNGSENIFEIVIAGERDVFAMKNDFFGAVLAEDDFFAAQEGALRNALPEAEPKHFGLCRRVRSGGGIVGVENGEVVGGLIFKDARFGGAISRERAMTIEVIGSEIEKETDVGSENIDEFELEAAEFGDGDGLVRGFADDGDERRADIAGENGGKTGVAKDVLDERGGGGFSVGAGDTDEAAVEKTIGELDFAPDGDAVGTRLLQQRRVSRNAGAGDDEVLIREQRFGLWAEKERDICGAERLCGFGKFGFGAGVGCGDDGAVSGAEERSSDTRAGKSED